MGSRRYAVARDTGSVIFMDPVHGFAPVALFWPLATRAKFQFNFRVTAEHPTKPRFCFAVHLCKIADMKLLLLTLIVAACALSAFAQMPKIEPGVSKDLAAWRAAHYSDIRYKLDLTLEKMSPVLKGSVEIRLNVGPTKVDPSSSDFIPLIILDWRKLAGYEKD